MKQDPLDGADVVLDLLSGSVRAAPAERDVAAEARDAASASAVAAREVTGDRVAAALDRHAAALRAATESVRDIAVEVRLAAAAVVDDERRASADREAAAVDRFEAALDRDDAADDLRLAYRDGLTGALLRTAGSEQLGQAADRAHRTGEPLVFAFVDVDGLKSINDSDGHGAGDALLRAVGKALRIGLRSYDVVVRYGGDEFVCALPGSHLAEAASRVTYVQGLLVDAMTGASVSFGLAELQPGESVVAAVARADAEMYRRRRIARDGPPS